MLATALTIGAGASVFHWGFANSNPFGGSDPSTCGPGLTCSASSFTGTTVTGSAITISSQLTSAVDLGPGGCDMLGTNVSGQVQVGDGCTPTWKFGDSFTINGANITDNNGAFNCDGSCQIRDSGNGTLPINTTGGVVFNSTTPMVGFLLVAVTIDVGNITAQTCLDVTATVTGVEANDGVFVTRNFASTANYSVSDAYVTNAGTDEVTFRACNVTLLDINPASGSYLFWVVRKA